MGIAVAEGVTDFSFDVFTELFVWEVLAVGIIAGTDFLWKIYVVLVSSRIVITMAAKTSTPTNIKRYFLRAVGLRVLFLGISFILD